MAAFDPSVISQVGDTGFDPVAAKGRAYTLQHLMDEQQLDQLRLGQVRQQESDQAEAKEIFKSSDYSTPEGVTKTAEKLSRAGLVDQSREFLAAMQQLQAGKGSLTEQQYRIMALKTDIIGSATAGLVNEFDSMTQRGIVPQQAVASLTPKYQAAIQQLSQMKLPDGTPALGQQDLQMIQQNPGFNPDFLRSISQRSAQGAAALKAQLAFHQQETRDSGELEREREDRARDARDEKRDTERQQYGPFGKPPADYQWDPDKPGHLTPIPGGPKDPASAALSGREGIMLKRVTSSANEALAALQNIVELPVGASSGVFGVGAGPGHSLIASAKGALTNKLADQDTQDYNTMLAGVKRNLATIETAGLAPAGALTESFGSLELRAGDTQMTKLRKLAEIRQVIEKGIEPQLDDPKLSPAQKARIQSIIDGARKAVPFTQSDVTRLQRLHSQGYDNMTLQDLIASKGLGDTQGAAPAQGWGKASVVTP